jgi:methylenetetrahydrofolate reductase (NADPH)
MVFLPAPRVDLNIKMPIRYYSFLPMPFIESLRRGKPTLSFELFPPKNPSGWGTLYATLSEIAKLAPDYISVTYGAGGSTRSKTVDLVSRIQNELNIESMAHLTCVGHSREEIRAILAALHDQGIRNILGLRGDPPKGDTTFKPHPEGFAHASDLIAFVRAQFHMTLGCAFYPEKHVEAASLDTDIEMLKLKQDQGADFGVSQLFFDNESFYRYRDIATRKGVTLPLVVGLMPVLEIGQLKRFKELSGCIIPQALIDFMGSGDATQRGIEWAVKQSEDLLQNGVAGIHIYCLNKFQSAVQITQALRAKGYFPVTAATPTSQARA